ncbi:MAG: hypothetical protein HYU88_01530 [Chloroflexi bacterium]|nr:hypothetical protein [Chloroflexota bacterium]
MATMTSPNLIEYYARHLDGVTDEKLYDTEALLVLVARDDLEDRWDELTPEERRRIVELDKRLVQLHQQLASVLPSRQTHRRSRWWWFLHEGPQVREQALAVASTAGEEPSS